MRATDLQSISNGIYFAQAAACRIKAPYAAFQQCLDKYTLRKDNPEHEGYYQWSMNKGVPVDLCELRPMLVTYHEQHHYQQLMSTPTGFLIWRTINAQLTGINFLIRKFRESGSSAGCTLPFLRWFRDTGIGILRDSPPSAPPGLAGRDDFDSTGYAEHLHKYATYVLYEIEVLQEFVNAIQGRRKMSMQKFLALANVACKMLARRTDVNTNIEWTARDCHASQYLPRHVFSVVEIVEAAARIHEYIVLKELGADSSTLDDWRTSAIHGVYKPVFEWILGELGDPWVALVAIDISLTTPIDLSCAQAVQGKLIVEDVLPGWRLPRIVDSMKEEFWSSDMSEREQDARCRICLRANLPTPADTMVAALQGPLSGAKGWGADSEVYQIPKLASITEVYTFVEAEVQRAFRMRKENSVAFVYHGSEPFQPAIEVYDDICVFHRSPITEQSELLHLKYYQKLVVNLAEIALLSDGDISELGHIESSFSRTMSDLGAEHDLEELWSVKRLLRDNFGPAVFDLLKI